MSFDMLIRPLNVPGRVISRLERCQFRSGYVVLEPGREIGEHRTEAGEELIVLLEGTAKVISGGKEGNAKSPSVVLIPPHTLHNVKNEGQGALRYLYVVSMNGYNSDGNGRGAEGHSHTAE
jgi:quercetin dioxygenase-like cupin family protein